MSTVSVTASSAVVSHGGKDASGVATVVGAAVGALLSPVAGASVLPESMMELLPPPPHEANTNALAVKPASSRRDLLGVFISSFHCAGGEPTH